MSVTNLGERLGVEVTQGRFRLSTVRVLTATQDLLILEVDCHSKYPGGTSISWGGDRGAYVEIWDAPKRSLDVDEDAQGHSGIRLPPYTGRWTVVTDARRYTIKIVAYYTGARRPRLVWTEET